MLSSFIITIAFTDLNIRNLGVYAVFTYLFILVAVINGQNCSDIVGTSNNSGSPIDEYRTYILADWQYTVPCKGKVIAWNFCYKMAAGNQSFSAGIWRKISNTTYKQVNSTVIKFMHNSTSDTINTCQTVNLSSADQFIAPGRSIVGLYSNTEGMRSFLLYTYSNITTYSFVGNDTQYQISDVSEILNYTISINVHLG